MLAFWCLSVPILANPTERERAYSEEFDWARSRITPALEANRVAEHAEALLSREQCRAACPPAALDKLRARVSAADHARAGLFAEILARGLRQRLGLPLGLGDNLGGNPMHRVTFDWISERAGDKPPGLAVCENCSLVFEPSRKSHAWRCPACHRSRGRRVPLTMSRNEGDGEDLVGLRGELMQRTSWCLGCGELFESRRPDAACCSDRCRKRIKRGAPPDPSQ